MNAVARLASFAAVLSVVFGLAFAAGRLADVDVDTDDDHTHQRASHPGPGSSGHALELVTRRVRAGDGEVRFRVVDERGEAVTSYHQKHQRDLHLIVVAEDNLRDYQHVHPVLEGDTWTAALRLAPGRYRLFADTQPAGAGAMVLVGELHVVGGKPVRAPLPAPTAVDRVGPFVVEMDAEGKEVTFAVTRNGRPVTDLQPYLGADGHLVALRAIDLAYLHAHPEDGPAGPEVTFGVEFTRPGRHALYFDFRHGGQVRTAMFTYDAGRTHGSGAGHGH